MPNDYDFITAGMDRHFETYVDGLAENCSPELFTEITERWSLWHEEAHDVPTYWAGGRQ